MPYATQTVLLIILTLVVVLAAVVAEVRHRRVKLRLKQRERAQLELLECLRVTAAVCIGQQIGHASESTRLRPAFYAEHGEDLFLFGLFNTPGAPIKRRGFYIECGALDGVDKSVTYIFDACGWDGLLIEALPHLAEACRASRPHARVEQTAVSRRGSIGHASFVHVPRHEGESFMPAAQGSVEPAATRGRTTQKISVPLTTIDDLLRGHSGPIDLLVLDVEGAELAVLDGFDLERWKPAVMLIEDHGLGRDPHLLDHVSRRGYQHVTWIWRNRVLIHSSRPDLLERARAIARLTAGPETPG